MASLTYDTREVEARWQQRWRDARVFEAPLDPARPKFYCLEMLPYPSGRLHVGHVRNYALGDAVAWFERLRGKNVFHPIGWDAMGLPAENAAIKNGVAPAEWTVANIGHMKAQLQRLGLSYDWNTEIATPIRATTSGTSGSSCACSSAGSPTARSACSTGARGARPCSPRRR
jgi:leucyl-tRNA synthetase